MVYIRQWCSGYESAARSSARQRIRLPPHRPRRRSTFRRARRYRQVGASTRWGSYSPVPHDVSLCCTTCNGRNEVPSHACQLPIDARPGDN